MGKKGWKSFLNILFLLAVFALTLWSVFHGENLKQVLSLLRTAEPVFVLCGIICVVLFICGEAVVIHYLLRTVGCRTRFFRCCLFSFVGFFYSCITPSASGGQPMQVVFMRKSGIPVALSTVVLAIVTITYKLVLVLMGAVILIFRPPQLMIYLDGMMPIFCLGLGLNVIVVAALLLLVFTPGIVRTLARWTFSIVNRIHPFRDLEGQYQRLERVIGQYQGAADFFRKHNWVTARVFGITVLQRFTLFLVTWFTYLAFSLRGHSAALVISLQGAISVAVDMLPLPGGMGISENLFLKIFEPVFGQDFVLPGMLISRGISYYTQILISAVMTVVAYMVIREKKKR